MLVILFVRVISRTSLIALARKLPVKWATFFPLNWFRSFAAKTRAISQDKQNWFIYMIFNILKAVQLTYYS